MLTERGGDSDVVELFAAVVDRHLSALATVCHIAHALIDNILNGESSPYVCPLLPVLSVHQILRLECGR